MRRPAVPGEYPADAGFTPAGVEVRRTAGSLTPNSATAIDLTTAMDLTIPAAPGDVIEMYINVVVANEAVGGWLDAITIAGANYVGAGLTSTNQGVPAWTGFSSAYTGIGPPVRYTVVAGDVSGGNVVFRLRYKGSGAGVKTYVATAVSPFIFGGRNFGPNG
jgi:hypothetical protein